jgi:hypothetical protein
VIRLLAPSQAVAMDSAAQEKIVASTGFGKILSLFNGEGKGSQLDGVPGTAWGLLNATTEYADHHVRTTSDANRWASAQFGPGADLKAKAYALLAA